MELLIDFPGGARVDAHVGPFTIATDQPPDDTAPSPFTLFLASLGTCAGIYALRFCRQRGIATDGMSIVERVHASPSGMLERIELDIRLPAGFPEKYREAVLRATDLCTVKKHLEQPPEIVTTASFSKSAEPIPVG